MTSADVTEEIVCNMHNHYWKNVLKESCDERARAGEIKDFTGISSPYEAPADPELVIETDKLTMEESVAKVMQLLRIRGIKEQ
jgi:adenylylsulfate kinase-like enzyme